MSDKASRTEDSRTGRKRNSLRRTLIIWFLLLAMVPMSLVAAISYPKADASLAKAAETKLEDAAQATVTLIQNWFDYRVLDLEAQAVSRGNSQFLAQPISGLQRSGNSAADFVKSYDWALRVDNAQFDPISRTRRYDYIHDLFLIDATLKNCCLLSITELPSN